MLQNPVIKRFLAVVMMVLFAFSITPRKLLHDVFANHKDSFVKLLAAPGTLALSKAGFNCPTDNLVAESPFTDGGSSIEIITPVLFAEYKIDCVTGFQSIHQFFSELRGPPANV